MCIFLSMKEEIEQIENQTKAITQLIRDIENIDNIPLEDKMKKTKLAMARENSGHSQIKASVIIGVSLSTYQNAEKGTMPSGSNLVDAIERYIKKYGVKK